MNLNNIPNLIEIIRQPRKSGGPRVVYIMKCLDCLSEIKVRKYDYDNSKHGLKCNSCSQRKKPFKSLYNSMMNDHRKLDNSLKYEEFLEFTKIDRCHYCLTSIKWEPYPTVRGKFKHRCYFLDRKDNKIGYSKDNCVVCCTKCNRARGNRFSYEEWYGMTKYFRDKQ